MTTREVVLDGGSPWGFRLHGGADVNQPLRISRVNPGSKAALRGVREGDFITSINGQSTKDVSNAEAHALLKNSGDTLKLGLNEDCSGSPKRRQFKTVHQETHSETVKRSSTTSYSLTSSKIISQTGDINDTDPSTKVNGASQHTTVTNGDRNVPVSQRSTLSSTSSSSPPSTYTETGTTPQHPIEDLLAMSDNVTSSRSRRRRSRNQRKKAAAKNATLTIETTDEVAPEPKIPEYRVDSPPKLSEAKKKSPGPIKSKSLGDDEMVKIQELSETSESEDKPQSTAIITEVESDPDLIDDQPMISPEEELTLRNFLESLNLASAPTPETVPAEKSPSEHPKARKAQNRAAIEQYFMPIAQNPRFLDVICEETSDLSDRDQPPKHHPTPELEIPKNSPRAKRRRRFKQPVDNPALLLDTKIVEVPKLSHATVTCATPSEAEIVFLSDSESPEESWHDACQETRETDATEEKHENELSQGEHVSAETTEAKHENELNKEEYKTEFAQEKHESALTEGTVAEDRHKSVCITSEETDVTEEKHEVLFSVKRNGVVIEKGKKIETSFEVLTPPPTPDSASPKNETSTRVMYDPKKSEVLEDDNFFSGIPREILVMCTSGYPSKAHENLKDGNSKSQDDNSSFSDKAKWFADFFKQDDSFTSFEKIREERFEEESYKKVVHSTEIDKKIIVNNFDKTDESSQYVSDKKKLYGERVKEPVTDVKRNEGIKALIVNDAFESEVVQNSEIKSSISEMISTSEEKSIDQKSEVVKTCLMKNHEEVTNEQTDKFEGTKSCKLDWNQNKRLDHPQIDKRENCKGRSDKNGPLYNSSEDLNSNLKNLESLHPRGDTIESKDDNAQNDVDGGQISPNTVKHSKMNDNRSLVSVQENSMDSNSPNKNLNSNLKNQKFIDNEYNVNRNEAEGFEGNRDLISKSDQETDEDKNRGITDILNIVVHSEIKEHEDSPDANEKPDEDLDVKNLLSLPRLLPSPTPSVSSEGSSSRASSMSTARYIPMNSSIGDVTSLTVLENPVSLRELCLNYLLSLPFGVDVIQELADVALSIQALTDNLADKAFTKDFLPDMPSAAKWVGVPTERDPRLLMCLSPTQKDQLEKTRRIDCEADRLLDLHEKFIFREHAGKPRPQVDGGSNVEIKFPACGNDSSNESRLLAIIRDEPQQQVNKQEDFLYYVAKGGTEMSAATLPSTARLRAKDLNEWLQLARSDEAANKPVSRPGNRRQSLPQELYAKQMEYLLAKECEIQRELENLEEEKRKLIEGSPVRQFRPDDYHISRKGDYAETKNRPVSMPAVPSEFFRQVMYEEYMDKIMQREERKQLKVIKVTTPQGNYEKRHSIGIEDEFMDKVKQKHKLGKLDLDVEEHRQQSKDEYEVSEPVLVMDGDSLKGTRNLPKHLQEFIDMAKLDENSAVPEEEHGGGVWSPGQKQEAFKFQEPTAKEQKDTASNNKDEPIYPVWTPKSATSSPTTERKEFRPVKFESPVLGRKNYERVPENTSREAPRKAPETSSETGIVLSSTLQKRLPTSHSSPASGFNDYTAPRLPRAQNPTITLLQKAREGQLPKAGALYIEPEQSYNKRLQHERPASVGHGEILYKIKNDYTSESDSERPPRKMADLGARKFEVERPTTRDGMPLTLRSEVKEANQSKWYKKMYDTIHKQKPHRDEYVTVRYKQRRGQYPYSSGYLSEPEPGAYDSDYAEYKYATLDRRRLPLRDKENSMSSTMPRNYDNKFTAPVPDGVVKRGPDVFKDQPGRIENYIPGHSSISEKEAKEWWDEVMDIFDGHLEQQKRTPQPKSFINQALKESGYESDSTLVFRRRDDVTAQQLSPLEHKEAYKVIQAGGDIPLHGLRKPAPERPKEPEPPVPPPKGQHGIRNQEPESPRKYVENEVTIHYKTPVRQEIKEYLSEDELAYRQAEAMKKIYQEERRRKYLQVSKSLQELQDMNNRRHTDNFIPSQKSPIPLNRYDDFEELTPAPPSKPRPRSPEPRLLARALYNFVGQTARELTFRKGDLIYVRRQVDKNWYEGELNAMVGLFPVNYVEIVTYDVAKSTPRKSYEGQARAKFNFVAQTHLELSLAKGELVVVTRRVDDNWFEGKIGGRKGIFPVSYVDLLIDPSDPPPPSSKPVASPAAHSLLLNGSAGGKDSMGSHSYLPNISSQITASYHAKPVQVTTSSTGAGSNYGSLNRSSRNPVGEALHIETQSEPIPYRALYKYLPQNDDELELLEGDTVYVLEKCDDGWYVGSSERTGAFGTFPGNYVEKI